MKKRQIQKRYAWAAAALGRHASLAGEYRCDRSGRKVADLVREIQALDEAGTRHRLARSALGPRGWIAVLGTLALGSVGLLASRSGWGSAASAIVLAAACAALASALLKAARRLRAEEGLVEDADRAVGRLEEDAARLGKMLGTDDGHALAILDRRFVSVGLRTIAPSGFDARRMLRSEMALAGRFGLAFGYDACLDRARVEHRRRAELRQAYR